MILNCLMTESWTDLFGCLLIIKAPTIFLTMSVSMARAVMIARVISMAMTGLTLQDKLEKV